jgi:urease accessory protein
MMQGSVQSAVEIAFRYDAERQRTLLTRRKAGGLCHLGKPYWDGEVLALQLVNPTAGLFAGDRLSLEVDVGAGASVALTSPSASRYHTMPDGRADLSQRFHVRAGAWLDYWPEFVIPQRDSSVRQTTEIDLDESAQMVFLDRLAPGRVAHGESYAFRKLESTLQIRIGGELQVRERSVIEPARSIWPLEVPGWDHCYYGAIWIAGENAALATERLATLRPDPGDIRCGTSLLSPRLGAVRVVARSSILLRQITQRLRFSLREDFPLLATDFRKL